MRRRPGLVERNNAAEIGAADVGANGNAMGLGVVGEQRGALHAEYAGHRAYGLGENPLKIQRGQGALPQPRDCGLLPCLLADLILGGFERCNLVKGDHHTVDLVVLGSVGQDTPGEPLPTLSLDLSLARSEPVEHKLRIVKQGPAVKAHGDVAEGPANIAGNHVEQLPAGQV